MSAVRLFFASFLVVTTVLSLGSGLGTAHPLGSTLPGASLTGGGAQSVLTPTSVIGGNALAPTSPSVSIAPRTTEGVASPLAPSLASRAAFGQQIMSTARADHIPMAAVSLPNLLGSASVSNGVVSPISTVAPAPMGIGTFGVTNTTGTPSPYTIRTSSWEGTITINSVSSFWLDNDGASSTTGSNNTFGVQLNAVTNDTTVGGQSGYAFWTQNVFYWNLVPGSITFLDNVWNFSSPATTLTQGTIYSGNGTPVYPEFYYDFGPTVSVTLPVTVHLYMNSSTTDLASTGDGYSTIRFGYSVVNANTGASEGSGIYDTVLFSSNVPYASVPASPFLVDGSHLTPTNFLLYDAEIMIGGPGGGTTTSIYGIDATESLQYLSAGTSHHHGFGRNGGGSSSSPHYVNPPSAWNVGTDTGETSEGIAETYTTPGVVSVTAGPSIPAPFWNATPGGNAGATTFSGPISPSNAFVFFTPGRSFNANLAAWAPTQTSSAVSYTLPPGTYTVSAMLSDYRSIQTQVSGRAGHTVSLRLDLTSDQSAGVYTPLYAWDNSELSAISSSGSGSSYRPYELVNNAPPHGGGLNPVFGEMNDYLFPVFPGLLLSGTSAHVDISQPSLFGVTYPSAYDAGLEARDLPTSNNLQFELFDASNVSIWDAQGITGWFFYEDYGPTGFLPLSNVVVWGGQHDLVGDSTFVSQGSSLLLAGLSASAPTGNVVWGNTFENSTALSPTMYPGDGQSNGTPVGIFAFESGDLIYNNAVDTSFTAYAPDANMFSGGPQTNLEDWNLSMVEPRSYSTSFNGHDLTGTIVSSKWQGGNSWGDWVAGSTPPYDEYGAIATGGDSFPYPITAYSVTFHLSHLGFGTTWSVTMNGVTLSSGSSTLVFYEVPGTYSFTDQIVHGHGSINPASGTVQVVSSSVSVSLTHI
jgi:thermopsin